MNPGDQVILHKAVKPVTVAEVDGDRFSHYITPGYRSRVDNGCVKGE